MASTYINNLFSHLVYRDKKYLEDLYKRTRKITSDERLKLSDDDKELLDSYETIKKQGWEIATEHPLDEGYAGMTFINRDAKEVVISHRGTVADDFGNWKNNIEQQFNIETPLGAEYIMKSAELDLGKSVHETIVNSTAKTIVNAATGKPLDDKHWANHIKQSESYTQATTNYYGKHHPDWQISHTGHSLGGRTASINAAKFKQPAEVYDPPGSKGNLEYLKEQGVIDHSNIVYANANTTTHLSEGSAIDHLENNTPFGSDGYHGTVHKMDLGDELNPIERHSISNIKNNFNHETGTYRNSDLIQEGGEELSFHDLVEELRANVSDLKKNI